VDDSALLEEVIVTGSAIRRSDLDTTLPIQIITEMDIKQSGVTNTAELIAKVPAMQNYVHPADTVGGTGGGLRTANLRGIGDQYTLVLLNGRRIAPADSGSTFDIQGIPLAAIERVEILTDGASALYGADAIAGVVNFILKDSVDETTVTARYDMPDADGGGDAWDASIVTGFGDVREDGYSFVFTYQHLEQDELASKDRDFAKTGFVFFNAPGFSDPLYFQNSSPNAIPGNAYIMGADGRTTVRTFNPYYEENGSCHENSTLVGDSAGSYVCQFDYTSTLFILPESESDTMYLNGQYMINDDIKLYGSAVYSQARLLAKIAPYPTGRFPLPLDNQFVQANVVPYMTDEELATSSGVQATWRGIPAGNRNMEYTTDALNLTVGLAGSTGSIDWDFAYTHSESSTDQDYPDGWLILDKFLEVTGAGLFNPFVWWDQITPEEQEAIDSMVYHGNWDTVETEMDIIQGVGSMPLFNMGGGSAMIAAGFDWRTNGYDRMISEINANDNMLFNSPDTPYALERDQWGVFVEALFPFSSNFELTAALRYDDIGGVKDTLRGAPLDNGASDTTYKVSAKWDITDWVSVRGSYGTGFKAPSMREIGEPRSEFGVTSADFPCPFTAPDPLAEYCIPGLSQYNVFQEGYAKLRFETSTQYTAGLVFTPGGGFDATVDYWVIEMEDLIDQITENQIFDDPVTYRDLFTTKLNNATGFDELAIIQAYVNVATKDWEGIDYNLHYQWEPSWAVVDFNFRGTHMLEADSSLTGSSLGQFGNDDNVVFEDKWQFATTVTFDNWTHALIWDYKSSYLDDAQTVELTNQGPALGDGPAVDVRLTVPSYDLWHYNVRWDLLDDRLGLTFGVNNLFDDDPPLSLRDGGAGHQVGWDPRYVDAYGRTYFGRVEFSFF
jgi:iron complex outermembrane receptor protein